MLSTEKMGMYIKLVAEYTMNQVTRKEPGFRDFATLFWGQQGIGKTSGTKSAANALKIPNINLRLAQYPPEDFGIPRVKEIKYEDFVSYFIEYALPKFFPQYETDDKGQYVMRREIDQEGQMVVTDQPRINFKLLKNHIANYDYLVEYYEGLGLDINDAPGGILLLDEITRIADPNLFQMIFQLPENFGLRDYKVPAGISIFAAANPPSDDYQVGTWFDDAAFANRFIHIGIKPDFPSWRKYAVSSGSTSNRVVEFYSTYQKALFEKVEEFNINDVVKRSPRSSEYLHVFDELIDVQDDEILFNTIQGILGTEFASNYMKFRREFVAKPVTGEEIVFDYDIYDPALHDWDEQEADSEPRRKIVEARAANRADYLNEVADNLVDYLEQNVLKDGFQEKMRENVLRITRFLFDLPADVTAATVKRLIDEEDDVHEAINDVFTHCIELYNGLKKVNKASKASN